MKECSIYRTVAGFFFKIFTDSDYTAIVNILYIYIQVYTHIYIYTYISV